MDNESYATSITVNQTPAEVFAAVTNVRGWWSRTIVGNSENQGDEFIFEVPGVHHSTQKLVEVVPNKRIVWLVTEANMTFIKQADEWVGTKMIFDISPEGDKTKLTFTHDGLMPKNECYKFCMPSWEQYINDSLYALITTGKGTPNLEETTIEKPVQ